MIIDYYSEELEHEGKRIVGKNTWDTRYRKEVFFLVIISISIQNLSRVYIIYIYTMYKEKAIGWVKK